MVKNIKTLVKDIQNVLCGETPVDPKSANDLGQRLGELLVRRLGPSTRPKGKLGMSQLGHKCDRKLWYDVNEPESAEPLTAATRLKFLYGDIIEELVLFLAKMAGHDVQGEQDELDIQGIKGHRDAIIDGMIVDVKSANSRGMDKFKNHKLEEDDPFGYITQGSLYTEASKEDERLTNKREFAFLAVDKELGHIVLDRYPKRSRDWDAFVKSKQQAVQRADPPPRAFTAVPMGASGNTKLCTECKYCPHKAKCWPSLRTFIYSYGPEFLVRVERTPNVPEVRDVQKEVQKEDNEVRDLQIGPRAGGPW